MYLQIDNYCMFKIMNCLIVGNLDCYYYEMFRDFGNVIFYMYFDNGRV